MARLKKFLKRAAIGSLLVLSVLVLIFTFFNWQASRRVEAILAPLREAGKPVSIADLQPDPVPDENNAANLVQHNTDTLKTFDRYLALAWNETEDATEAEQTQATIKVARRVSKEFPNLNPMLRTASKLPAYHIDLDYQSDPNTLMEGFVDPIVGPRTIVRALHGHGLMSLADGNVDDAVADAQAILNWSRHIGDQPLMINHLVATACYGQAIDLATRCLSDADMTDAERDELLSSFPSEEAMRQRFLTSIDSERAFGISSFGSFPGSRFMHMLGELETFLENFAEFESFAEKPTGLTSDQPTKQGMFGGLSWSSQRAGLSAFRRQQAFNHAIQILAAWQGAGRDREANLSDFELPEYVITDPYDGSLMKLKMSDETILIYSVGENQTDDSGSLADGSDIGIEAMRAIK